MSIIAEFILKLGRVKKYVGDAKIAVHTCNPSKKFPTSRINTKHKILFGSFIIYRYVLCILLLLLFI